MQAHGLLSTFAKLAYWTRRDKCERERNHHRNPKIAAVMIFKEGGKWTRKISRRKNNSSKIFLPA